MWHCVEKTTISQRYFYVEKVRANTRTFMYGGPTLTKFIRLPHPDLLFITMAATIDDRNYSISTLCMHPKGDELYGFVDVPNVFHDGTVCVGAVGSRLIYEQVHRQKPPELASIFFNTVFSSSLIETKWITLVEPCRSSWKDKVMEIVRKNNVA